MSIPARLNFVTLAVRDLERMAAFYRALGWPESSRNNEHHIAFRCGGAVLGLFSAKHYEARLGPAPSPGAFRGFTLALNLESRDEVDRVHAELQEVEGATLGGEPQELFFGGRGFTFQDPEGNEWDVLWAEGTSFDERGGLIYP